MRVFALKYILVIILVVSGMRSHIALSQSERGSLPVYNFSQKTYNAGAQNLAVIQDKRGVMYFGNNQGILEYDGNRGIAGWKVIDANRSIVRSLDIDKNGRIYAGGVDEFGYLAPDSIGNLRYHSLVTLLDSTYRSFSDVWKTFVTDRGIFFQTYDYIFIYDDSITVLTSESTFRESYYVKGTLYVRQDGIGLTKLQNGSFVRVPGGDRFADEQIFGMVPYGTRSLLVASLHDLFRMDQSSGKTGAVKFEKIHTEADAYLDNHDINSVIRIDSFSFSIGMFGGGIVILSDDGKIIENFDKTSGLEDDIIYDQYLDGRNNLWLAMSQGVSRIEIHSPMSWFGDGSGLSGTIQSITRFNDKLYVATLSGLFYLEVQKTVNKDVISLEPKFVPIEEMAFECWDLLRFTNKGEEFLLVANNDAVRVVDRDNQVSSLPLSGDYFPYDLYQSRLVPGRVYIGLWDGLASVYRDKGKWIDEGRIEGISENVNQMSEDIVGNLWMGTESQGVLKLNILSLEGDQIEDIKVSKYDTSNGLPEGPYIVSQITGPPDVATSRGLYKFNQVENSFKPDTSYGKQFGDGSHYIHRISEYRDRGIWIITYIEHPKYTEDTYQAGYLESLPGNRFRWVTEPFIRITEEVPQAFFVDANRSTFWMGGSQLYRYEKDNDKDYGKDFNTLIRKVSLGSDSLIFGGTNYDENDLPVLEQPPQLVYTLNYRYNNLIFNYSAPTGDDESFLRFSYFLEGFDDGWSDWSDVTYKEYTNLREGDYTFHVKAKNAYNHIGKEATFAFTVMPPWYRTIAAYIGYVIFFIVFVYTVVRVYSRQLRAIIRERTAEVVMQKEEIEMKNQEITDSIHYASRIQSAILPPDSVVEKHLTERFILYLPRDIVSGDFYWLYTMDSKVITVAADCTGHGVPGAFMSMLGVAFLNEIVSKTDDIQAHEILNQLRAHVITSLHQTGAEGENKDGMDIALCVYDLKNMKLEFAGANNPLYLIRDGELITYKADKMPIGIHQLKDQSFTLNEIDLKKGDIMYTFSDGYADQFGGPKGKKFMSKKMKEMFLEIHKNDMETQKQIIKDRLYKWMENTEQVDDVIVMGVRV